MGSADGSQQMRHMEYKGIAEGCDSQGHGVVRVMQVQVKGCTRSKASRCRLWQGAVGQMGKPCRVAWQVSSPQ